MAKLRLTIAFDKYDYLQPLRDGQIQVEGIDLNLITVESGIRHERMFHHGDYDACEFSMSARSSMCAVFPPGAAHASSTR